VGKKRLFAVIYTLLFIAFKEIFIYYAIASDYCLIIIL